MFNKFRGSQLKAAEIGGKLKEIEREYDDLTWRARDYIKERFRALVVMCEDLEMENARLQDEIDDLKHKLADKEEQFEGNV
jgi:predicted  nucleic acid-binding Zn-ribbon protein